ncbi:hypothetical protein E2C01_101260 [Portunus trituberculatus]|uniref:Uncharacterized protein n=1 Tax=Portunus trituberculatus TaxID=210409 RepID=A0A5B7KA78_PORTR|nr:hypothetical protein [Portunus trituberculatus]
MTTEYLLTHSPHASLPVPRAHVLPQLKTGWYYKQYTTDTTQQMIGAHSRPPKHTGDYSHHQQQRDETITRPSTSPHPSGRTHDGKCSPQPATLSLGQQPRCPTQPRSNRVANQLLKGGHNSQTND